MLQAWLSIGYIVLLAILVLAFILWRRGGSVLAIAALVVGIPLWFGWEYARPTWTTGVITGTEVTLMWNRWRSTLFSWYPNAIAIGSAGSWPWWSVRTIIFYGLSVVLWLSYFYAFFRLSRSNAPLHDRNPDRV